MLSRRHLFGLLGGAAVAPLLPAEGVPATLWTVVDGHQFVVFPQIKRTWIYDCATAVWHERLELC